jgi:hypothetical protein
MFGVIWIQGHLILSDWEYISRSGLQLKIHELRGQMLEDEFFCAWLRVWSIDVKHDMHERKLPVD